jgi:hypothetical protein
VGVRERQNAPMLTLMSRPIPRSARDDPYEFRVTIYPASAPNAPLGTPAASR